MYFKFTRPIDHTKARGAYPANATHLWFIRKLAPSEVEEWLADMPAGTTVETCAAPVDRYNDSGLIFN